MKWESFGNLCHLETAYPFNAGTPLPVELVKPGVDALRLEPLNALQLRKRHSQSDELAEFTNAYIQIFRHLLGTQSSSRSD